MQTHEKGSISLLTHGVIFMVLFISFMGVVIFMRKLYDD